MRRFFGYSDKSCLQVIVYERKGSDECFIIPKRIVYYT